MMREVKRQRRPVVYIIAGPNGAGKTTFAMKFLPRIAEVNFINADLIAAGVSPLNPGSVAVGAGRIFLARIRELVSRKIDFAFETTLSGRSYINLLSELRSAGYRIHLFFLWLPSLDLALKRVADRVRKGGHNIPAEAVGRRFKRGIHNLFNLYRGLCDLIVIYDNSTAEPRLVATIAGSKTTVVRQDMFQTMLNIECEAQYENKE
ncbi:MAG: zeta toxin family protein [Kiritimatiellia bacterium]|nr:zeta toxin family protein [Kiritimatiellia bacterium]